MAYLLLLNYYYLQTPEELLESKCGICYDQVEFIREFLKYNPRFDIKNKRLGFTSQNFIIA